jgi:DNA polymerase III epsilon subunit-like protein
MEGRTMLASTSTGTIKRRKVRTKMIPNPLGATFAAIDFETANRYRDSACAVSVVSVIEGVVDSVFTSLIRPPTPVFEFTAIHGISYADVKNSPSFEDIFPALRQLLGSVPFIAAHNANSLLLHPGFARSGSLVAPGTSPVVDSIGCPSIWVYS